MGSKSTASLALLVSLNLLLFSLVTVSASSDTCPMNTVELDVCLDLLGGSGTAQCCPLLQGLVDVDAAVCLCTAIKASLLGINLDVPVSISVILNACGKNVTGVYDSNPQAIKVSNDHPKVEEADCVEDMVRSYPSCVPGRYISSEQDKAKDVDWPVLSDGREKELIKKRTGQGLPRVGLISGDVSSLAYMMVLILDGQSTLLCICSK
ncbi:hypothetical protein RJ640_014392 [Escallonia rubra]|uniref:Bifunctional inhibitor/plant lipid transfer protein/seed storage helical domain-containing protein n=1 Tax=Escallonia rubra TaxID=112253 RepID=A0AA88QKF8_9ASTE|nr:hypothetical protein RJ640_014392 [Escallonia rubra]